MTLGREQTLWHTLQKLFRSWPAHSPSLISQVLLPKGVNSAAPGTVKFLECGGWCCHRPLIQAFWREAEASEFDLCELQASLAYRVSSRPVRVTQRKSMGEGSWRASCLFSPPAFCIFSLTSHLPCLQLRLLLLSPSQNNILSCSLLYLF